MTQTLRHKKLGKNLLKYATKKEARIQSGYSKSYASSGQILKTKGYKKTAKPILERYRKELGEEYVERVKKSHNEIEKLRKRNNFL